MRKLRVVSRVLVALGIALVMAPPTWADDPPPRVRTVALSPDGKLLAAGVGEPKKPGGVTVWDFATRKVWLQHAAKEGVSSVAFSPDSQLLAVGSYDGTVRLFDVGSKEERGVLKHEQAVRTVAFNTEGDLLATAGDEKIIRLWNHAEAKVVKSYTGAEKSIRCVALSSDGKMLVAGADDAGHVWDAKNERSQTKFSHDGQGLPSALFLPGGRCYVTGGYDGRVIVWDAKDGVRRFTLSGVGGVGGMAYCPKTETLAICSWRSISLRRIPVRDTSEAERKRIDSLIVKLDEDAIEMRESACDELLKIGLPAEPLLKQAAKDSKSAEVRLRARKTREKLLTTNLARLSCDESDIDAAAFSPDGKHVVGAGRDGYVYLWDIVMGKLVDRLLPVVSK